MVYHLNLKMKSKKKYDDEYQKFLKELELEKEKYNKAHPEQRQQEIDEKYESESDRQFRTILDVQNGIHQSIRTLDNKFAEVLGRQERTVSLLSNLQGNNNQGQGQGHQNQGQMQQIDTFNRLEVNQVMNQQNEIVRSIRDIFNSVVDVQQKTNIITANVNKPNQQQQQQVQQQPNPIQTQQIQQLSDELKAFRHEMNSQMRMQLNKPACPEATSCLTPIFFTIIIAIQSILFICYFIWKSRSEAQMKKFY